MMRLQDVSNQRMELLRRRSREAYEATLWLRQNEGRFKGKVYAPIMTQIDLLEPSDAKYVEAQIPTNDLVAFVAERQDDLNAFLTAMRDTCNLSVNGVVMPSESLDAFQPRRPLSQISQYGFRAYVQSLFTAPDGVMRYLCKRYRVHDIPVGSAATEDCLSQLRTLGINRFFTEENLSIMVIVVRRCNDFFFIVSADTLMDIFFHQPAWKQRMVTVEVPNHFSTVEKMSIFLHGQGVGV
ncbi:hypothetical protein V5799_015826 [Amblyomma americanum]|uniref:Uncharacterized protein n=1 Tax=Amblyomma americanum TaxID=6943 RepID=A0AAQ4F846_AMBAM